MDKINVRDKLLETFPETTDKRLHENNKWCPDCKGLGFKPKDDDISICYTCKGSGQIELCINGCGKDRYRHHTRCEKCQDKYDNEMLLVKEKQRFNKATKVSFAEYDGKFLINERVVDKEELLEILEEKMSDMSPLPEYIYGTTSRPVMNIDFRDVVSRECEEGYEDMTDYLDFTGVDEIQLLIDNWIGLQGDHNCCYDEDVHTAVILDMNIFNGR